MKKIIVLMLAVGIAGAEEYKTTITTCDLCGNTTSQKIPTNWSSCFYNKGEVIFYEIFGFSMDTGYYWIRAGEDKLTMCPKCTEKVVRNMYDFADTKKKVDWIMNREYSYTGDGTNVRQITHQQSYDDMEEEFRIKYKTWAEIYEEERK